MSVLVDWQIKELLTSKVVDIWPLMDDAVQSNSVDIRLGNSFAQYTIESADLVLDPYDELSTGYGLTHTSDECILIGRGAFLLAETMETIKLPSNVCATLEGKSSLARIGLTIHQTGGWIDAGFEGTITLEMTNENVRPIMLRAGMPIAQLVLYKTERADVPYNVKKNAKYTNQCGATASRYHQNVR